MPAGPNRPAIKLGRIEPLTPADLPQPAYPAPAPPAGSAALGELATSRAQ